MGIFVLTAAVAHAGCLDPAPLVEELEAAATEARLGEGEAVKSRLMVALACGPVASPQLLARIWLADAVMLSLRGEEDAATDAISAAAHVAPEVWNDVYGPEFRRRHLAARGTEPGIGQIVFDVHVEGDVPADRPVTTAVDGRVLTDVTPSVSSGLHVAQIGFGTDDVRFAQEVFVVAGQDLVVRATLEGVTGVAPVAPVPVVEKPERSRKFPAFLVAGGVAGLGAGVTAAASFGQNGAMRDAEDLEALDSAFRTQKALGYTSYALLGAAAACVGLELVF